MYVDRDTGLTLDQACPNFCQSGCALTYDDCHSSPCLNGGTCVDGIGYFSCICPQPLASAEIADTCIDECASSPCLNGGTCVDGVDSFSCACPVPLASTPTSSFGQDWGDLCADDCAVAPCLNGGVCIDGVGTFRCVCPAGFCGPTCADPLDATMAQCPVRADSSRGETHSSLTHNAVCDASVRTTLAGTEA